MTHDPCTTGNALLQYHNNPNRARYISCQAFTLTGSHLFHCQAKQSVGFCLSAFSTFPASAGVARSLPLSGSAVKQDLCRLLYSPCLHNCCHSQDLSSYPSMPRLSWLVKLYGNLTYVRMRPAAIALNYSVKDIRHDVRQIIIIIIIDPASCG